MIILVAKSLNKKQLVLPNETDFPGVLKRCPIVKLEGHENRINHLVWQPIVKSLASSYVFFFCLINKFILMFIINYYFLVDLMEL